VFPQAGELEMRHHARNSASFEKRHFALRGPSDITTFAQYFVIHRSAYSSAPLPEKRQSVLLYGLAVGIGNTARTARKACADASSGGARQ